MCVRAGLKVAGAPAEHKSDAIFPGAAAVVKLDPNGIVESIVAVVVCRGVVWMESVVLERNGVKRKSDAQVKVRELVLG